MIFEALCRTVAGSQIGRFSSRGITGRRQREPAVIGVPALPTNKLLPQKLLSLPGLSLNWIASGGNPSSHEKSFNQRLFFFFFNINHQILCKQILLLTRHISHHALISLRQFRKYKNKKSDKLFLDTQCGCWVKGLGGGIRHFSDKCAVPGCHFPHLPVSDISHLD